MTQNKLTLPIPAYLATKTDSVAGTMAVKKMLTAAFAGLPPPNTGSNEADLLLTDLCTLMDRIFLERVAQKSTLTGAMKPERSIT